MINFKYKANSKANGGGGFRLAPEGTYNVKIVDVKDWEEKVVNVSAYVWDDSFHKVKDENGKDLREPAKPTKIYTLKFVVEICDGEYAGVKIYDNITTHPNIPWSIPHMLSSLGVEDGEELDAKAIKNLMLGKFLEAEVGIKNVEKEVTDGDTGLSRVETRQYNELKKYKKSNLNSNSTLEFDNEDLPF